MAGWRCPSLIFAQIRENLPQAQLGILMRIDSNFNSFTHNGSIYQYVNTKGKRASGAAGFRIVFALMFN